MRKTIILTIAFALTIAAGCTKIENYLAEEGLEAELGEAGVSEAVPSPELTDIKLLRLDGEQLELTDKPIPLRVNIKATFPLALTDEMRSQIEGSFKILDPAGGEVDGEVKWDEEGKSFTFKPAKNFEYATKYSVTVADKSNDFVTMTKGDINGDGTPDFIISSPHNDSYRGKIYIYSGANYAGAPMATKAGETISDYFGRAVVLAGDVNADGYSDVLVYAYFYDHDLMKAVGKVYVYSGADLGGSPIATMTGDASNDLSALEIAAGGDVDGDGYADVMLNNKKEDYSKGKVYIYSGADLFGSPIAVISGTLEGEEFGTSMAGDVDVNGDGRDDVILATPHQDDFKGKVYIYSGADLQGGPITTIEGESESDWFGKSLSGAGDIDGDGKDEIIIGAPGTEISTIAGKAYIYSGADLSGEPLAILHGENPGTEFGVSIAGLGDIDGDGKGDIIVGAPSYEPCLFNLCRGKIYIYSGAHLDGEPMATIMGEDEKGRMGSVVAGMGDIDGDRKADFMASAPIYDISETENFFGRVYIFSGADPGGSPIAKKTGEENHDEFGRGLSKVVP